MKSDLKAMAAVLRGSTDLTAFKKEKKVAELIVRNGDIRELATRVRKEVANLVLADTRSSVIGHCGHRIVITFADDIPSDGTRVQVWLGKVKMMEHLYHPEASWPDADDHVERTTLLNLLSHYYAVLWKKSNIEATLKKLLQEGNGSVKLPNGQTLKSEVRHRAGGDRSVSLYSHDDYPIFSMITYERDPDQGHILGALEHNFSSPGLIGPADHSFTLVD